MGRAPLGWEIIAKMPWPGQWALLLLSNASAKYDHEDLAMVESQPAMWRSLVQNVYQFTQSDDFCLLWKYLI